MPVLRLDRVEKKPLLAWLKQHSPDVLVVVHIPEILANLTAIVGRQRLGNVPQKMGMVVLSQVLRGADLSGREENGILMGESTLKLLVSRIMNRDFGIPKHPKIQMVESQWIDGKSLRQKIE
jgi:LacI family transcriptional regulator